jgi:hypothetical protein
MTKRWKRWVLAAGILLVGGELAARFYLGLGDPPLSQPHPTIEYLFKPNQRVHRFGNLFATNRYGMRSADFAPQKQQPGELRILVFGDSVINGGNLTDQARLATTTLQNQLGAILHRPVIVGNVSAGSWGPPNQLAYLRQFGFLDADIVVLVLSSSDFDDAPTYEPLNPLTHPTQAPVSALWEGITRYLPRFIGHSAVNEAGIVPDAAQVPNKRDIEVCAEAEREFFALAQAAGVRALLLQHWTALELRSHQALPGYAANRQIALDAGVPVADDADLLESRLRSGHNPFRDDIHLNDVGQAALHELLLSQLQGHFADTLQTATAASR